MKLRKVTALFLVGAMCVSALVGCGNTTTNNETQTETANVSTENTTVEETEEAVVEEEAITATITVWGPAEDQSEDMGMWLQTQCDAFNAAHPSWDLTFEYGTCGEGDAGRTISQDPSASGDVYFFANDQLPMLIDAGAISELGGQTADYVMSTNSETIVNSVTVDGGIYGVPFTTNTWFMYYDKSVFSEDDIKSLDAMLTKDVVSFPLGNSWYVASFFVANGGTLFGADGLDEAAGIDFSGDKGVEVADYLVDLAANSNFVMDDAGSGMAGLTDGSIKAMFSGAWDYNNALAALGDNLGIAQLPMITINGAEKQLRSFAGSKAIGVNPNCEYPQVAVALALFLGNAEAQLSHYELRSIVPCNTELLAREEIQSDALVLAQNATFDNTSILQPFVTAMNNYWTPAENFGRSVVNGEVTHENAAEMIATLNESLNGSAVE